MAKVNKKAGSTQGVVIQNITIRPVVRTTQDIEKWRHALQSAEAMNPVRVPLYDLYADMLLDGRLTSLIGKRISGVTKVALAFVDADGKDIPAMAELIAKRQFRKLRREMQWAKHWGITVAEITRVNGELSVYLVPRKHVKPNIGRITYEQYGNDGYDYRLPPYDKYIVQIGEDDDLGLLLKAAPYVIYKRGGFGDWANFAEIFGMPFREARYDGYNDTVRLQLEEALKQAGSAGYAILPKEAEIKFHESKNTNGSSELFDMLRKACNEELAVLILGQTETTTSSKSSGYAQSQTHAGVEDQLNHDDCEDELAILNEQILPILANLGYPVAGGKFVHRRAGEKMSKKDTADMVIKLRNEGKVPIDDDYIYDELEIPKPAAYDTMKSEMMASQVQPVPPPADPENPDPQDDPEPTPDPSPAPSRKGKKRPNKLSGWDKFRLALADFFALAPEN